MLELFKSFVLMAIIALFCSYESIYSITESSNLIAITKSSQFNSPDLTFSIMLCVYIILLFLTFNKGRVMRPASLQTLISFNLLLNIIEV